MSRKLRIRRRIRPRSIASAAAEGRPPLVTPVSQAPVQADEDIDTWPGILRLFRFRLLKTRLRQLEAEPTKKEEPMFKSPIAAGVLALLAEIDERGSTRHPANAQELAYALDMDNPSLLSDQTGPLVASGLCTEQRCADDRREWHYAITEKGKKHLDMWLEQELGLDRKYYKGARSSEVDNVIAHLGGEIGERLKKLGILA